MASLAVKTGVLGKRLAAHLLRRTTYCPSQEHIDTFKNMTATQAVNELVNLKSLTMEQPVDPANNQPWINNGVEPVNDDFRLRKYVKAWWLEEAMKNLSLRHKMVFFLHTNFSTHAESMSSERFFDYLALLDHYCLGNFRVLAEKMTLDNLMLRYLDNYINTDDSPNENYAREFLELFTIGKGPQIGEGNYTNYTESDIVEAAKVLTGFRISWTRGEHIDPDTDIPRGRTGWWAHERSDKTFSEAFQNTTITGAINEEDMWRELSDFVDMIFDQDATAIHICRKIYRFFVSRNITSAVEQDIILPLASTFRNSDYSLESVMKQLLKSQHFYDADDSNSSDQIIGALLKSPLDLYTQAMVQLKVPVPNPTSSSQEERELHYDTFYRRGVQDVLFENAGFNLFQPPSVASYPAYHQNPTFHRNWFSSSSIIARYKWPEMLITGKRVLVWGDLGLQIDMVGFVENNISNPYSAATIVTEMLELMLPETPSLDRYNYFLNGAFMGGLPLDDWAMEWSEYVSSGDPEGIRPGLNNLLQGIMFSPEYQLM